MSAIVCISSEIRTKLIDHVKEEPIKEAMKNDILKLINSLPKCDTGIPLDFGEPPSKGRRQKKERKRSPYQEHISACMIEHKSEYAGKGFGASAPTLKRCAQDWRKTHPKK